MTNKFFINGEEVESYEINLKENSLSEFLIHQIFKQGNGLFLMTKIYYVGESEFPLGTLQIDATCKVKEENDEILAEVFYPYHEFQSLERFGKRMNRNGLDVIQTTARVKKSDIMKAIVFKLNLRL